MKAECHFTVNLDMRDKKVILYGIGRIFKRYQENLNWDNIIAIVDTDVNKQGNYVMHKKIESPDKLSSLSYDYIAIFTDLYFESAKTNLIGNYFVEEHKIVSWRIFFNTDIISEVYLNNEIHMRTGFYKDCIESKTVKSVLDIGRQQLKKVFLTNENFIPNVDNLGQPLFKLHKSFYRKCYEKYAEIEKKYDILLLWEDFGENIHWDNLVEIAKNTIIWTIPYSYMTHKDYAEKTDKLQKWGEKRIFLFHDAVVYVFKKERKNRRLNCEIFVVTHKKYNVLADELYKPICVGSQYENKLFYTEHTQDNISYLNDRINECTALYWIWKNTNSEYVGLNHYRRFFYNSKVKNCANYLTEEKIKDIFENGYDFILPEMTILSVSVFENITRAVGEELGNQALKIIDLLLSERQPRYMEAFKYVMSGNIFYRCHMFVTNRKQLDAYSGWLFSFLTDAAEQLDVSGRDALHKRTMGYFAETMLTVWLLEQEVRVKELPITEI